MKPHTQQAAATASLAVAPGHDQPCQTGITTLLLLLLQCSKAPAAAVLVLLQCLPAAAHQAFMRSFVVPPLLVPHLHCCSAPRAYRITGFGSSFP
jgi:hypothetical protein